jgi:photosystem II stability/assembly factor-like uncharacterized protein
MLLVGSDDGIYRVTGIFDAGAQAVERVLESGQVYRIQTLDDVDSVGGALAATADGLYHSSDLEEWRNLGVPRDPVYAVGVSENGHVYAGTRPAHIYVADAENVAAGDPEWHKLDAFHALAERDDWGIERHDGVAQVRDVVVPADDPERVVAGVEVGGVYVSDDGGETWTDRSVEGFDAPHTDDIHHVLAADAETFVAATGSGLYRTTDAGRSWTRLDVGHRQRYFRESVVDDGVLLAGGSPTPPNAWTDDRDHALFESRDGQTFEAVDSPVPDEVAVGWCDTDDGVLAVTNLGTLLHRGPDGWARLGTVPAAESIHGRCMPLAWVSN